MKWPHDDLQSKIAFFGDPRKSSFESQHLTNIIPPYQMYYDGHPIKSIRVNKKIASALLAVFTEIYEKCEHSQEKVDEIGASAYGGCYNFRPIRGSSRNLSNHAFGAAIDINPQKLPLGSNKKMNVIISTAFKNQNALLGQDYKGRKDPMHAEFVSR